MNSRSSNSESRSTSFNLLDPRIQRWIWEHRWTELRDAQERAIPQILKADTDVIIAASTAAGKTEAAFLPIFTSLAAGDDATGLAVYISPLKALINDQWQRLEQLAEALEIPVTPWHGDIPASLKQRFFRNPSGCVLITPESIEGLFVRHGSSIAGVFANVRYVVIDEMHSFMGTDRGKQLQSQLSRLELLLDRRVCRIGLSATLGDMERAKEYLRPESPGSVALIDSSGSGQELQVLVKGYIERAAEESDSEAEQAPADDADAAEFQAQVAVSKHLFGVLRGSNNLVFPNSRRAVEFYADRLRRLCEDARCPNEFWPHHGSLSREIREETEAALKQRERPATAICTNTLELGIDIGAVKSVVQIGSPPSVASLRQRLGRSGRRKGEAAILRGYAIEHEVTHASDVWELLRGHLVQTIAMIRLLARGWFEPAPTAAIHASTLVQQVLSVVSQYGGCSARQLWTVLCERGAFRAVNRDLFMSLLRHLGQKEFLFQDSTGLILLAPKAERMVEHYSFYATFDTEEEFRVIAAGRVLGSLAVTSPLTVGGFVIFAGRRWEVVSVVVDEHVIEVKPAAAGTLPGFGGMGHVNVHEAVRTEMREVFRGAETITFLDKTATEFLEQGRANYRMLRLDEQTCRQSGNCTQLFPWAGDRAQDTLVLLFVREGLQAYNAGLYVGVMAAKSEAIDVLKRIVIQAPPAAEELTNNVSNQVQQKWDALVPSDLLAASFVSSNLDFDGAVLAAKRLISIEAQASD